MRRADPSGLRSFLFAPGDHARRVAKALTCGADAVILDLEDAVVPAAKEASRASVAEALQRPRTAAGYVRVNSFETAWCAGDLEATLGPWLDGVILPKTEGAAQLRAVDVLMGELEEARGLPAGHVALMPMIESARGISAAEEIAAACPRVRRLSFGGVDYTLDLDLEWTHEERELDYARARLAHASRLAGIEPPIDTVVPQVQDLERFRQSARNARRMGFQGKCLIHPDQLAPCHEVFTPDDAAIARARAILAAFDAAQAAGSAVTLLDGQLVEYPVVCKAQRVLALAARLDRTASPALVPGTGRR